MSRAVDVVLGVVLILSTWSWMVLSIKPESHMWLTVFLTISKIGCACLITGPIYREYLK